ncbi:MAG: DUF4395 domain-containing protein [Propionicimonas sp.]|uniref:DUF4395 domain-containing protein n=1 Tax=Propionicimonas sp. TaxID=1955623 RepID=UPI003D152C2E
MSTATTAPPTTVPLIDPRAPRFSAALSSVVLAAALLAGPRVGTMLLGAQAFAYGAGAVLGLHHQPYGWLFRRVVRPRLGAPADLEDARPPRVAQAVGFGLVLLGVVGATSALPVLSLAATGLALVGSLLTAILGGRVLSAASRLLTGRRSPSTTSH